MSLSVPHLRSLDLPRMNGGEWTPREAGHLLGALERLDQLEHIVFPCPIELPKNLMHLKHISLAWWLNRITWVQVDAVCRHRGLLSFHGRCVYESWTKMAGH
jgi:hypothetical protein